MPPPEHHPSPLSRRWILHGAATIAAAAATLTVTPRLPSAIAQARTAPMPSIHPRSAWTDIPPRGPLAVEAPGDLRFVLVHHSASGNAYGPDSVPGLLRSFHSFHTSSAKGWPDIAYNFLVDRHGGIWEGRAGSIEQPVRGDATGGSQGFAMLACLIGNHEEAPPTAAAAESMTALLAWLAARYDIDPQGRTAFVSRGSNRHPAGTEVDTATIAGHREMSQTGCPGSHGMELVAALPPLVAERMSLARTHFTRAPAE